MTLLQRTGRALASAAIFIALTLAQAYAAPSDYRFELASAQAAGPGKTTVTVRLVHVPDNNPVTGAVLFETKTDMTPSGMADMSGKVSPVPVGDPGLYRFEIETGMAGKWQLVLAAKVQGEAGSVRGTVIYEAAK